MPRPDVSDERIPQILKAAAQIFSAHGIDGASMAQVARAAGVSKATVYYYFKDKRALVEALVHNLFNADQARLNAIITDDAPALTRIEGYTTDLVALLEEHAELYPIFAEFKARAARMDDLQTIMQVYFSGYTEFFAQLIQQGIDAGHVRGDVKPEDAALTLTALIEGCIVLQHNTTLSLSTLMNTTVKSYLKGLKT